MSRYILQRLFGLVGVLFGVSIVLFLALHLAPGERARLAVERQVVQAHIDQVLQPTDDFPEQQ